MHFVLDNISVIIFFVLFANKPSDETLLHLVLFMWLIACHVGPIWAWGPISLTHGKLGTFPFILFHLPGWKWHTICHRSVVDGLLLVLHQHTGLCKKLGSGHSTKSFLISHEILSILVLKVS